MWHCSVSSVFSAFSVGNELNSRCLRMVPPCLLNSFNYFQSVFANSWFVHVSDLIPVIISFVKLAVLYVLLHSHWFIATVVFMIALFKVCWFLLAARFELATPFGSQLAMQPTQQGRQLCATRYVSTHTLRQFAMLVDYASWWDSSLQGWSSFNLCPPNLG